MTLTKSTTFAATLIASSLIVAGCDSSTNDTGTLSLSITDAPVDSATEVVVEFTGVELKPADGQSINIDFDSVRQIDLLALQNGLSEPLLDNEVVSAGAYQWVRLKVNADNQVMDSYISFENGETHSLYVPSGSQSGLKLNSGFNVAVGQSADFTIDFDLRKSVVDPTSAQVDYILKPSLRIIDNTEIGSIEGTVANATMEQASCVDGAVVYLFSGSDVTPDDLGSANEPLSSANITYDETNNIYRYTLAFLAPGDYSVALTCEAQLDDPEVDDDISFISTLNAAVASDEVTIVNFN
ncbi:MAG: DUF4382 domain-containing protein [Gammaproteobacteria bacterium]|nr:DUF4382 domain-containing protein [Gammaproteobacteria bacterium]